MNFFKLCDKKPVCDRCNKRVEGRWFNVDEIDDLRPLYGVIKRSSKTLCLRCYIDSAVEIKHKLYGKRFNPLDIGLD